MTQISKPPTPRRCQRILQAHRLRCQGLSLSEIARAMHCARSTVCAYLRDLKLHYRHILQSVAADQLLNLIPALTDPDQEPAQHHQQIATVRELRLLLTNLPQIETALPQPEPAPEPKPAPTYNPNEMSVTRFYAEHPEPELDAQTESDLQPPTSFGLNPDPIEPNLDKSGLPEPDSPAPNRESAEPSQDPPPKPKIGPQYQASWDNPGGYTPAGATVYNSATGRTRVLTHPEPAIPRHRRRRRPPGADGIAWRALESVTDPTTPDRD